MNPFEQQAQTQRSDRIKNFGYDAVTAPSTATFTPTVKHIKIFLELNG